MPRRAALAVLALCLVLLAVPLASASATAPPPSHVPPVDATVVDPFRPPTGPYGPGNRGLEYGTAPGTPVAATAAGTVTFAGLVAGTRHVTVRHPDGVRTTYSFLARVEVVVGQRVARGQRVGTTVGHLHLGARRGDAYFDPASLFGGGPVRVRLVPFDEPPGRGPGGERSAVSQLIGGVGDAVGAVAGYTADAAGATAGWLRDEGSQTLRTAAHYLDRMGPGRARDVVLTSVRAWVRANDVSRRACTPTTQAVPAPPTGRRVAVLVGGLGSSSDDAAIDDLDTRRLGYDPRDVARFSYDGGRIADPDDGFAGVPVTAYAPADTTSDLRIAGRRLADLIDAVADDAPGAPLDVYAHSQGGIVARLALAELERRHGSAWLERLGLVATLGTPHGGADLATAIGAVGTTAAGSIALDGLGAVVDLDVDDDDVAVRQLSETSDLVAELARTPLPAGISAVSIAARGDVVVPVPRTEVAGAPQVVVPLTGLRAHDALPGSAEAARELALALGGLLPTCVSFRQALGDQLVGEG
ncbi:MAG: peptidoglycan DD-metalloendopeptidase family protein, partial [Microthrixaceae bacterium]